LSTESTDRAQLSNTKISSINAAAALPNLLRLLGMPSALANKAAGTAQPGADAAGSLSALAKTIKERAAQKKAAALKASASTEAQTPLQKASAPLPTATRSPPPKAAAAPAGRKLAL
jgi:hypothetical protein